MNTTPPLRTPLTIAYSRFARLAWLSLLVFGPTLPSQGEATASQNIIAKLVNEERAIPISAGSEPYQLSETLDIFNRNATLELLSPREHRIEVCFETSASFTGEGPHIELTDWVHGYTKWTSLSAAPDGKFIISGYPQPVDLPFPEVSRKDVATAIREHLRKFNFSPEETQHWVDKAKHWNPKRPSVMATHLLLRISFREDQEWRVQRIVRVPLPTGC